MRAHTTGLTIAFTALLAAGLSFAPIPEAWKPVPSLDPGRPGATLARALMPQQVKRPSPALASAPDVTEAPVGDGDDLAEDAAEEEELLSPDPERGPALSAQVGPAATLGAAEARRVRRVERRMRKIGAKHVDLEQACLARDAAGTCTRQSLDAFFDAVEALQRGERTKPVRILHLGDSQIASDYISDTLRRRLELRYGRAGPGFLFVDRPTRFAGRKVRTGEATDGWEIVKLTDKERSGLLGATGVRFTASRGVQRTRFAASGARTAEVAFLTQPEGGTLQLFADDSKAPLASVFTRFPDEAFAQTRVKLPSGTQTLSLSASGGEVSVFGVSLETGGPGIVYDSVGLPGAMYEVYLRATRATFISQLRQRDPSLVVLMLGGNEAYEMGRGWQSLAEVKSNATALLEQFHLATPKASCLVMSPMEAGTRTVGGEIEPRRHTVEVSTALREVAAAQGCAFWDLREAMGGEGSVSRWLSQRMFNPDLIHPLPAGAEVVGHLLDFALERARAARPDAQPWLGVPPGLVDGSGKSLLRTFARLKAVKEAPESTARVNIVQLGASHTASHLFTDVVRANLARNYGSAGRGFVAAGRPSDRLTPSGVRRELRGDWQITDARERPPGEPFGLTGIRAVGQPHASLSIAFGQDQDGADAPAQLSLFFLQSADMGRLVVRIDGQQVAELGPRTSLGEKSSPPLTSRVPRAGRNPEPVRPAAARVPRPTPQPQAPIDPAAVPPDARARVVRFPVTGTSHVLEVENAGPGLATIFGAAMDQEKGGVDYDALGLPGATASLLDGYDREALVEQLRARHADLYVLFLGTNESALPDLDPEDLARTQSGLLQKLREASPEAECLIIGPTDRIQRTADGRPEEAPSNGLVTRTLREVAQKEGCAFWSARAAMGGPLSMARWQSLNPPLGHEDGTHLTAEGYAALAHAFVDDFLGAR